MLLILMVDIFSFVKRVAERMGCGYACAAHLSRSSVIIVFPTAAPAQPSSAIIAREVQARLSALWALGWPQVALEAHPWQGTVVPSCLSEA